MKSELKQEAIKRMQQLKLDGFLVDSLLTIAESEG